MLGRTRIELNPVDSNWTTPFEDTPFYKWLKVMKDHGDGDLTNFRRAVAMYLGIDFKTHCFSGDSDRLVMKYIHDAFVRFEIFNTNK